MSTTLVNTTNINVANAPKKGVSLFELQGRKRSQTGNLTNINNVSDEGPYSTMLLASKFSLMTLNDVVSGFDAEKKNDTQTENLKIDQRTPEVNKRSRSSSYLLNKENDNDENVDLSLYWRPLFSGARRK